MSSHTQKAAVARGPSAITYLRAFSGKRRGPTTTPMMNIASATRRRSTLCTAASIFWSIFRNPRRGSARKCAQVGSLAERFDLRLDELVEGLRRVARVAEERRVRHARSRREGTLLLLAELVHLDPRRLHVLQDDGHHAAQLPAQ